MSSLISVNVGLPRDVEWQGRVVRTAIRKRPVPGRVHVHRLNIDGDGQGILPGMAANIEQSWGTSSTRIDIGRTSLSGTTWNMVASERI
jgi:hypothetical protein